METKTIILLGISIIIITLFFNKSNNYDNNKKIERLSDGNSPIFGYGGSNGKASELLLQGYKQGGGSGESD